MFDIGFWELAILAVIGLIVLGPERLPVVARRLGLWVGRARGYVRGITSELDREIRLQEMREHFERTRRELDSTVDMGRTEADSAAEEVRAAGEEVGEAGESAREAADESVDAASDAAPSSNDEREGR